MENGREGVGRMERIERRGNGRMGRGLGDIDGVLKAS